MPDDAEPSWGASAIAAAAESPKSDDPKSPWYKRLTQWVPVVGKLWDCRPEHVKEAFYEVACVLLFSTLPLWFFPLISTILFTQDLPFFSETVSSGELLIYAASLAGTMVYFISKRYGSIESRAETGVAVSVSFPYGRLFIVMCAVICMFSAAAFFMLKVSTYLLASQPDVIDKRGTGATSWLLFAVSVVLFFCAVAFRNLLEDGRSYRNDSAENILKKWDQGK